MSITLYTAPECIRCKIVKAFLAERDIPYATVDFKADAQEFNAFYRANRKAIYRNPEGVEFPLFNDGQVIKQGSGEIIAYLLSGHVLEACITRSDLLHGKIGGIYDFLLTCQVVILFQIQPDVLHIRVGHGGAGASVVADGLDNVGAVGQQIVGNRAGEQRIVLKHRQAILDTVADTAFFRGV